MIKKFNVEVFAVQWQGDNIEEMRPHIGNFDFDDTEPGKLFAETVGSDWVEIEVGDWILVSTLLEYGNNEYYHVSDETFQKLLSKVKGDSI